mmetsp:Transcript_40020/g.100133  ORF Transcript_40020/g.100133 Transcript_40020/m.100133 type:complete len:121 (-) Transcript_40020:195-557(-)
MSTLRRVSPVRNKRIRSLSFHTTKSAPAKTTKMRSLSAVFKTPKKYPARAWEKTEKMDKKNAWSIELSVYPPVAWLPDWTRSGTQASLKLQIAPPPRARGAGDSYSGSVSSVCDKLLPSQ